MADQLHIFPQDAQREPATDEALLRLATAAAAIVRTRTRMPGDHERLNLADAVSTVLRIGRLHGLQHAPNMRPHEATETFRAALRLARAAGVAPLQLISIFNGDEEAGDEAGRKDFR
jgi:hypothetical protein